MPKLDPDAQQRLVRIREAMQQGAALPDAVEQALPRGEEHKARRTYLRGALQRAARSKIPNPRPKSMPSSRSPRISRTEWDAGIHEQQLMKHVPEDDR